MQSDAFCQSHLAQTELQTPRTRSSLKTVCAGWRACCSWHTETVESATAPGARVPDAKLFDTRDGLSGATVPCLGPGGDGATVSHATRVQARRANRQYKKEKTAEGFAQVASMSHRGQNIVFGVLAVIMLSVAGWFFSLGEGSSE